MRLCPHPTGSQCLLVLGPMALRRRQGKVTPPLGNEELVPAVMTPEKRDSGAGGGRYSGRRCTVDIDGLRFGRDLSRSLAFLWERRASKCLCRGAYGHGRAAGRGKGPCISPSRKARPHRRRIGGLADARGAATAARSSLCRKLIRPLVRS